MIRPRGDGELEKAVREMVERISAQAEAPRIDVLPTLEYDAPGVPAVDASPFPLYLQSSPGLPVKGVIVLQAPPTSSAVAVSWDLVGSSRIRIRCISGVPAGRQRVTLGVVYAP
ncbi:MAG: hypothetical protein SFW67_35550 [Myxococcaceae bacterium]|nr:hypothetical protein [Myxococcaceae bacterium]